MIGKMLMLAGVAIIATTLRRPPWLGGRQQRYMADDTASAALGRASRRSLGAYLILGGALFWLVGV